MRWLRSAEAAMQQIVEGLQVAVQANDVPEENKWDGNTKTNLRQRYEG